ncbi:ssk1 response regulator receiver, partial [Rhizopus stolonifer]
MVDLETKARPNDLKPTRPRLGYLRSAWTTTDLYLHSSTSTSSSSSDTDPLEENIYQIRLPPIQLHDLEDDDDDKDEVLRELFRMITVANILCLSTSLLACSMVFWSIPSWYYLVSHYQEWMPHVILPLYLLWWLFMMLVLRNRTEHLRQYLNWTQTSAVVMASTNYLVMGRQHIEFVAVPLLAALVFAFAKRLWIANDAKTERFKRRVVDERNRLQVIVDQCTEDFSNHRIAFLSTISQEIQDVALMVITTLEQFSPASILANTHELLSACSLAVPISSISAINTTIRQVCHVSSHLPLLSKLTQQAWSRNTQSIQLPELVHAEFDIGELLQNVGDALAGVASKLDVNFVIYHCDNNLHHLLVVGDEGAIRHALLNHLRNILECCTPGACIEVGLNITPLKDPHISKITFYITHTSSPSIRNANAALLPNANLTAQLLSYIHASSTVEENLESNQTRFEFTFELKCSQRDTASKMFILRDSFLLKNHYANIKFSNEPSLKELMKFIENLKGLKMVLHAHEQSIFAKHLTSFLASWNTDISHVPVTSRQQEPAAESSTSSYSSAASTPSLQQETADPALPTPHPRVPTTPPVPSPAIEEEHIHAIPPAFILIDDDIATLESTIAIIHFTSLTKYKAVRDTIQSYAFLPSRDPFSMPRIVVVPKPAGPRRFLTALHTAWYNAVVEPHFSAIATSPSSPMPPAISMLVQREMAQQQQSPNEIAKVSPSIGQTPPAGDSPGRRNGRPLSGIFNPPDNYFSSQQQHQEQQASPGASTHRRRSTNNNGGVDDYLTAKNTPLMSSLGGSTSPAVAIPGA